MADLGGGRPGEHVGLAQVGRLAAAFGPGADLDGVVLEVVGELLRAGLPGSASEKGPVSLRFPVRSEDVLFPRLFLEG